MKVMAHYKNGRTCPICGAPDWCGERTDGEAFFLYCHRYLQTERLLVTVSGDSITTRDGREFIFRGETSDGYGKFQDKASIDKYREQKREASYIKWMQEKFGDDWRNHVRKDISKGMSSSSPKEETLERALKIQPARAHDVQKEHKEVQLASIQPIEMLDRIYRKMLQLLVLEEGNRKILQEKDGWEDDIFRKVEEHLPIRSLPPVDMERFDKGHERRREFFSLKNISRRKLVNALQEEFGAECLSGVPGFYQRNNGGWSFDGMDGYIIPQINVEGYIYRLRIRANDTAKASAANGKLARMSEEERSNVKARRNLATDRELLEKLTSDYGKYMNFASQNREGGCASGSHLSFYGLWLLDTVYPTLPIKRVIVCEGEKKGIIASIICGYVVITLPGVSSYRLLDEAMQVSSGWKNSPMTVFEWLRSKGITRIAVANDTDMAQNELVRKATMSTIMLIQERGFTPEFVSWDPRFGKGLDDNLLRGGKLTIRSIRMK